ncbi:hypothetical protein HMPREF9074_09135, partial [Capnocytophaga sp. oral taxon 329 str. F0087]
VGIGGRLGSNIPPNTYSAALARGLPSKGEMQRASIHEQYDVGTGGILCKKTLLKAIVGIPIAFSKVFSEVLYQKIFLHFYISLFL